MPVKQLPSQLSLTRLKRFLAEYRPQLEKAIAAIQTIETLDADERILQSSPD